MARYFLLLIACLPLTANGQFTFFSQLTNSDSISYLPYNNSRGITAQGQYVHIVYTDRRDGAGEVFYLRSQDNGITWDPERRLTTDDNIFSGRATIAAWNNEVHIVWMDRKDGNNELYYSRSTNNGNTWSTPERLTNNGATSEYPSMAIDFQSLHLVWNDARQGANEIYYKRSTNGGLSWTADMRLTNSTGESYKPSIAVSDSLVHVLWEDLRNGNSEIFYKGSSNHGEDWSTDLKMSNSTQDTYAPCISANGTFVFATWDDTRTGNGEIFSRRSINGGMTWGNELNISNSGRETYNAFHTFAGTFMGMAYAEINGPDLDMYYTYSTDAGSTWSSFVRNTNASFSDSDQPFLAISGSTVHLVYQDDFDGNLNILYSRNPNGNPFPDGHQPVWSHQINSTQTDIAYGMVADPQSNVYVTGSFSGSVDVDPGPGTHFLTSEGSTDAFVYKLNNEGALVWAKRIGGPETDNAYDIALDASGNVVIAGSFHTIVDFDPGDAVVNIGSFGQEDIFILTLDASGNYVWAKRMGGGGRDEPQGIAINSHHDVITTGYFEETVDFDPGPSTMQVTSNGASDIFISMLNQQGELVWAKTIGSVEADFGRAISANEEHIALTGSFRNTADFDPGAGQQELTSFGESDNFILELDMTGQFTWVRHLGSTSIRSGYDIVMDPEGLIYALDITSDPQFPQSITDFRIYSLAANGNTRWNNSIDTEGTDVGCAVALRGDYVYVAATFTGATDFAPGSQEIVLSATGGTDILLQKLVAEDGDLVWLHQFGGSQQDVPTDLAMVSNGHIGLTGYFSGIADFSPSIEQQRMVSAGVADGFVTLFSECEPSYAEASVTACDEYIFNADYIFHESGTYTVILASATGCDSIITLQLTIDDAPESTVTESACDSYTTPSGAHTWNASGVYTEVLAGANGCDSIVTYNLTIHESSTVDMETSACDSYTDPEGIILTESGMYTYTYTSSAGCDSIIRLDLTIYMSASTEATVEACDAYSTPDGLNTWTSSGTYAYTTHTVAGCDSVITIQLFITDWDTAITVTGNSLVAVNQFANFQWVDCNNGFAPVFGENISEFTPGTSGSYAVIIGSAECFDTSACYTVTIVGNKEPGPLRFARAYPNPATDVVYFETPGEIQQYEATLTDLFGRTVLKGTFTGSTRGHLKLEQSAGVYLLTLAAGEFQRTFRVVKM